MIDAVHGNSQFGAPVSENLEGPGLTIAKRGSLRRRGEFSAPHPSWPGLSLGTSPIMKASVDSIGSLRRLGRPREGRFPLRTIALPASRISVQNYCEIQNSC
jgi:hypothetical protein